MKLYNICTKKEYESNGQKKTIWLTVGSMRENDDGKKFVSLNMWPNESFYVFDQKAREAAPASRRAEPEIEISNDDIPQF